MTLVWPDGHTSRFTLPEFRSNCPCALCRSRRGPGGPARPTPTGAAERLRVEGAELVGNYGLQLRWNDGHETGIYSWDCFAAGAAAPSSAMGRERQPGRTSPWGRAFSATRTTRNGRQLTANETAYFPLSF